MLGDDGSTAAVQVSSFNISQSAPNAARGTPAGREAGRSATKRKWDESEQDVLGEPFTIEAPSSKLSSRSITLNPALVIDRSCLPLAYLDLQSNADGAPGGAQIFAAKIPSIDNALQRSSCQQPLLIARSCRREPSLYAVERADASLYALCPLGRWVTVKMLEQLQGPGMPKLKKPRHERINPLDSDWWRILTLENDDTPWIAPGKRGLGNLPKTRLCLERRPVEEPPPLVDETQSPAPAFGKPESSTVQPSADIELGELPQKSSEDVFAMLRTQYQDNLYISKASLAYFAKGPLSRARASLGSNTASPLGLTELASHLRSSILSTATMDKKYKEAVPTVVQSLPTEVVSEDDTSTVIAEVQKKIRKTKKQKISKDGLYPSEELNIARWWLCRDSSVEVEGNAEDSTKASLLELRARETQMQIILLLETLALESSHSITNDENTMKDVNPQAEDDSQTKKRKPKKPQDLSVLLDILVDRLCIWQSMRVDDDKPTGKHETQSQIQIKNIDRSVDTLKTFCVDVVLPFYGARLPEISTMLRQKLGGPKTPSPMRPPLAKAASSTQLGQKPGTALQRPGVRKPRRTLERVLTDEKAASQRRAPGLSRSNTDSALPGLKREASDTSLHSIPLNRVAVHKSKRYAHREVDLKANSQAAEAKARKKASVEQELQGAIAALKKPNPRMAVKELVEAADEKRAASSHSRKPKNPVRNLFAQGVQVNATPKGERRKDVFGGLPRLPSYSREIDPEPDEIPPSSIPRVPSTVLKHTAPPPRMQLPSFQERATQPIIEQTPTRGPSRYTSNLLDPSHSSKDETQFLTPTKPRRPLSSSNAKASGTSKSRQVLSQTTNNRPSLTSHKSAPSHSDVQETPMKPQARLTANSIIITSSPPTGGNSISIYDALGWNDFDELS